MSFESARNWFRKNKTLETKTETAKTLETPIAENQNEKKETRIDKQIALLTNRSESTATRLSACSELSYANDINPDKKEAILNSIYELVDEIGENAKKVNEERKAGSSGTIAEMGEREEAYPTTTKERLLILYGKLADRPDLVENAFKIASGPEFFEAVKKTESLAA